MKKRINVLTVLALLPFGALAQAAEGSSGGMAPELLLIIYTITGLLLFVTFSLWRVSIHLRKFMKGEFESIEQKMYDSRSVWEKLFQLKPVGTDKDVMMGHSYDGIRELDNPPPPWFMFLFYGTIVFAVIYFVRFSITGDGPTQEEEYIAEMQAAEAEQASFANATPGERSEATFDESMLVLLTSEEALTDGKAIYQKNCKVCHADGGRGSVGPNLTDEFWVHGGGIKNVYTTIKDGVISKGMQSWNGILTPEEIQKVSSYILSLEKIAPPDGLEPQGEMWKPEPEPEADSSSTEEAGVGQETNET